MRSMNVTLFNMLADSRSYVAIVDVRDSWIVAQSTIDGGQPFDDVTCQCQTAKGRRRTSQSLGTGHCATGVR